MYGDAFWDAMAAIVRRVIDERKTVDFRARYPGSVLAQNGQTVDVEFDDKSLKTKTGVRIANLPGREVQVTKGARVTVGWLEGDESKARAFLEWDGDNGLVSVQDVATERWGWTTPLATFSGRLSAHQLLNGASVAVSNFVVGTAAGSGGTVEAASGGAILASVTIKAGSMAAPGPLFTMTFPEAFRDADGNLKAPEVFLFDENQAQAAPLAITPVALIVSAGASLVSGQSYKIRIFMVG